MSEMVRRVVMGFFGVSVLGVCVAMLRIAELGTDPFTVFVIGIGKLFGITFNYSYSGVVFVFLIFVFFIKKHYIGVVTILNLFLVGWVGQISYVFLSPRIIPTHMYERIFILIATLVFLCFASSLYIVADLGVSTYDAISLIMADKKVAQYRFCRIATDMVCVVLGFLLGVRMELGVGTIITAFFMGPITQFFITYVSEKFRYGKAGKPVLAQAVCAE